MIRVSRHQLLTPGLLMVFEGCNSNYGMCMEANTAICLRNGVCVQIYVIATNIFMDECCSDIERRSQHLNYIEICTGPTLEISIKI